MPWTRKQVRYLESSVSPLTADQKEKMNRELHSDPSLGHKKKGSEAMKRGPAGKPHSSKSTSGKFRKSRGRFDYEPSYDKR